ncbi:MAG: phosphoribosylformylglycinamidine synthase subunit PurL [Syntrophomonadaceae bacterium]|jgi:phosphoribosylformylglycinamidine synthase|nr:phosphoribosylformylglycinamidine synthase subunit PurL [Syntrophomonadaceae bacterium]
MKELTYKEMGLTDEEYEKIIIHLRRKPNYLELGMFAVMWSEHCCYKNSRHLLKNFPTKGAHVIQGPGENAGVVDIGDKQALVFKIESHNHPSAIEPYQGAATGVGGIVRDIFTMGARPVALLNSLRFGPIEDAKVKSLFSGVVSGIAGYGNCLGIPTVGGEVYFGDSYKGNPLVNAMCVGLVNHDDIALAVAGEAGRPIMIVGSKTGRDGIHGATFASEELTQASQQKRPAVQVGDPFMEKLLIEACLELIKEDLVIGMQDLGAAGLTSSIAETVSKSGYGVEVDVQMVPRRETKMSAYEVMLSESQERMLIVPRLAKEKRVSEIFAKWGLDANVIGKVTGDGMFRVLSGDQVEGEIPVRALTDDSPVYIRQGVEPEYYNKNKNFKTDALPYFDNTEALCNLLASPNIASKAWIYEQYDHQVMANTVIEPGNGDAAVLRIKDTDKGVAFTTDGNGRLVYLDPFQGGKAVVCEAARNLACAGAKPLALTNCLNFGNPEKPNVYWQMEMAIKGMAEAAEYLEIPVVSGNVSLYNESGGQAVYPTPVVGMAGLLEDIKHRCDMGFKQAGDLIIHFGPWCAELGGSEYLSVCYGLEKGAVPPVHLAQEKKLIDFLLRLHKENLLNSCHDISEGGLAVALAEAAIVSGFGFLVSLDFTGVPLNKLLFAEGGGRAFATCGQAQWEKVMNFAADFAMETHVVGTVTGNRLVFKKQEREIINLTLEEAGKQWKESIPCHMR